MLLKESQESKKKIIMSAMVGVLVIVAAVPLFVVAGMLEMQVWTRVLLMGIGFVIMVMGIAIACVLLVNRLSENKMSDYLQTGNEEFPDMFLTAKHLEGCSDKTIRYYRCNIEKMLETIKIPVIKREKHTLTPKQKFIY